MGTYFPPLNLSLDADERAVKRAYAAALKQTRPDEDPVAFQALVAARDRALDWVRRRGQLALGTTLDEIAARGVLHGLEADAGTAVESQPLPETGITPVPATPGVDDPIPAPDVKSYTMVYAEPTAVSGAAPLSRLYDAGNIQLSSSQSFAAMIRSQQATRQVLSTIAIGLIRDEANGDVVDADGATLSDRWEALLLSAEDLDLSGRMALERVIAIELDGVMQQQANADPTWIDIFAGTVVTLDRGFRWSQDLRRIVRILGEPSGTHPLVFAIERFGENAIRLRLSPDGFPIIPESDLVAWFGSVEHAGVKAYRKAQKAERIGPGWSWYALLSPPAWCVRTGLSLWGIGFAAAAIIAVYILFDPIANVGTANAFVSFLVALTAVRVALAVAARALETSKLVRVITRIEAGPLPSHADRRRLIASAHGPKLLNVLVALFFLLLVDGYCLALIIPAMNLRSSLVADMIVVPDRKTPGVTFADRLVAQSYLDHAREIAEELDELLKVNRSEPVNPLRRRRIETVQQAFLSLIKVLPIGDYADDFDRFRREIAQLKRRQ